MDPYTQYAFALDGLIRSRVSGDGGDEYARKCVRQIADALQEMHDASAPVSDLVQTMQRIGGGVVLYYEPRNVDQEWTIGSRSDEILHGHFSTLEEGLCWLADRLEQLRQR